jgi:glycosyltransferase involved in cell wall biosynthesis
MRILWVKANKILPVHSGGDLRSFNILLQLASHNEVTFLSYYGGAVDAGYERELRDRLPGAICVGTGGRKESTVGRGLDYLMRLPNRIPYAVSRFASSQVREKLQHCLGEGQPDVVVCDFLDAAINFPERMTIPTVLFQHNVESEIWRRHAETEENPLKRLVYGMEFKRILVYEKSALQRFHHVIAVSEHDRTLMSAWADPSHISVVPTGVDLHRFHPDPAQAPAQPLVMFVGAMDWMPNVDAVDYFCREIWPAVEKRVPGARFRIVGRNPLPKVRNLASDSIEVTGVVPSVVEHLRNAAVVVVPLRVGGGTRLKIYEAMAMGRAVVSTSVGAEGLDVRDGEDIVLADNPVRFSEEVATLLENLPLRQRYERKAAACAARFDWPAVSAKFEEILEAQIARRGMESVERARA